MNNEEFDFKNLEKYELQVALDNILEQFGFEAVMYELEDRAFKECSKFFEGKNVNSGKKDSWHESS